MRYIILFFLLFVASIPAWAGFQDYPINQPYLYKFSSSTTVNTVKSSAGILHTLTVEGGTTGTIDIFDGSTSGASPSIASFTTTNALTTYTFDVGFSSGCTVITTGALKYTVSYL